MLSNKIYKTTDLINLALKVSPLWTSLLLIQQLINALTPAILVWATSHFVDTAMMANGLNQMWLTMLILCMVIAFQWLQGDIRKNFHSQILIATRQTYQLEILEKRAKLEYRYIEDTATHDLIERLMENSENQILTMFNDTLALLATIINTVSIALILFFNVWWAALAILAVSIPLFIVSLKAGKARYQAKQDLSKLSRMGNYLLEVGTGREAADERTLYGYGEHLTKTLDGQQAYMNKFVDEVNLKTITSRGMAGLAVSVTTFFVIIVLLQPVIEGSITIGIFIALVGACMNLASALSTNLSTQMEQFSKHKAFLKDLTDFCQLGEAENALAERSKATPTFESLQFKNVSFKYPGTDKWILDQANFTLKAGKHYAFVGENGAGKTTVIKLVTGLFTDYEGEILLNGKDLKTYSSSQLKSYFAIAYQDFAKYALTVKENILVGNLERESALNSVLADLELDALVQGLSNGLETPLGKLKEGGIDLSGGQWQRLALARVLVNPAPFLILDEPTAALDPLSESRLYSQFENIIKERTSLFISHRLGSIKLADEILVFKSGKVIEVGNHSKLMDRGGTYQKMYDSQLKWYEKEGA